MINPGPQDVGTRGVIYTARHGARQRGIITSYSDLYVFVRYGAGTTSVATRREDLEWEHP